MFKQTNGLALVGLLWLVARLVAGFELDDYESIDNQKVAQQMKSSDERVSDYLAQLNAQAAADNEPFVPDFGSDFEESRLVPKRETGPKAAEEEIKVIKEEPVGGEKSDKLEGKAGAKGEPEVKGSSEDSSKKKQLEEEEEEASEFNLPLDLFDFVTKIGNIGNDDVELVPDLSGLPKGKTSSSNSFSSHHHHESNFEESSGGKLTEDFRKWLKKMGLDELF